jgi:integrase/recombinase XerC
MVRETDSRRPGETMWTTEARHFTKYLQSAGRSPHTIRLRLHYVVRLSRAVDCSTPWTVGVDELVDFLSCPTWKPETRKSARASVCAFYAWGVDTDRIEAHRNPARRLPPVTAPRALPRPAPSMVFRCALLSANDRDRLFLLLAGYAGLRRAEIASVHPDDIDHERQALRVHGKGGKERIVPLHPVLYAELGFELERRAAGGCGSGWRYTSLIGPDSHLFPGRGGHVGPDVPGRALARLLLGDWTGHTLRHRFASAAYAVDRDLRAVQELLGHSKPETTARYVATPDGALRAAVAGVTAA